ncbi:hypothetical protein M427DRAFT_34282 [Gonapodya prolifera JEL478]|uniref:Uncharacterized protein n=1 Tax=Gonapodya prolifera (strain JEL478) TaxID=1344416 RepID=A0A139A8K8_GONPJ|nr:hypothetical protein M427DRAFT_34282 [Gonapodya prolifera JEL478]|eukprot:KXS13039.1 hypothetical protein M427DRAFT_34282 [Gonapodya prolifera JEL478]
MIDCFVVASAFYSGASCFVPPSLVSSTISLNGTRLAIRAISDSQPQQPQSFTYRARNPTMADRNRSPPPYEHASASASPHPPLPGQKNKLCLALMSGSKPKWYGRPVPRRITAISILGTTEIDLRGSLLQPGTTKIRCIAIGGGVSIQATESFPLEISGLPLFGGFRDARGQLGRGPHRYRRAASEPPPPELAQPSGAGVVVNGVAILGSVYATDDSW